MLKDTSGARAAANWIQVTEKGEKRMSRKLSLTLLVAALALAMVVPVYADKPNFGEAIYGDGVAWGTKGTTPLPAPNDHNEQSFDKLYMIDGQLPVSEAAPGNPDYNGGRWWTVTVIWDDDATPVTLTSFSADYVDDMENSIEYQLEEDNITLDFSEPSYFQCPLLPVKE
jgi:hypothetical protein